MSDKLITEVVTARIRAAEERGDVALIEAHLTDNYTAEIHRAAYAALIRVGMENIRRKIKDSIFPAKVILSF